MLVTILHNMSKYTAIIQFTTPAKITSAADGTVCFGVAVDHMVCANLGSSASMSIYSNKIMPYIPEVKVATDAQYVYYTMPASRLSLITSRYLSSGEDIECDMIFNLQCTIPEQNGFPYITEINVVNVCHIY